MYGNDHHHSKWSIMQIPRVLAKSLWDGAYLEPVGRLLRLHQKDARIVYQAMNRETLRSVLLSKGFHGPVTTQ